MNTARQVAGVLTLEEPAANPKREPLPGWARDLIEGMNPQNLEQRKKELLR